MPLPPKKGTVYSSHGREVTMISDQSRTFDLNSQSRPLTPVKQAFYDLCALRATKHLPPVRLTLSWVMIYLHPCARLNGDSRWATITYRRRPSDFKMNNTNYYLWLARGRTVQNWMQMTLGSSGKHGLSVVNALFRTVTIYSNRLNDSQWLALFIAPPIW